MATTDPAQSDALLCLKQSIAANQEPILSSSPDRADAEPKLALATHLHITLPNSETQVFPLNAGTRFISSDNAVDLRSILWAWQKKDAPIAEYISTTAHLNDELAASANNANAKVVQLSFVEKVGLTSWLDGSADECENIKPLSNEATAQQAGAAASVAAGASGGVAVVPSAGGAKAGGVKTVDPRLAEIYRGERKMGDRNTVLRGIKPTDFSHIRKNAEAFLGRSRSRPGGPTPAAPATNPALVANRNKPAPGRRVEPIILLSPSASSLLRTSNIRNFLEKGVYVPADSPFASGTDSGIIHISRMLPSIDPSRPLRFILVDSLDHFKPDYWSRVVAVFTTGQTWQFKSYKWTNAPELFTHALGIYVGFTGELVPDAVKGWGRGVKAAAVDKWNPAQGERGRWRDREVVETIWTSIEESMRAKGWGKDGMR